MGTQSDELAAYYAKKYPLTFVDDFSETDSSLTERYKEAWQVAARAAAILKERYGAQKVVAFGSLVDRTRFTRWSDVDLAAWGIPDDRFYAAVGAVTGISKKFKVDLVDPEDCRTSLRSVIESEGVEL
ncbi:putative nucleotidyl transferase domain-containing protein [Thermacetogenium phaeum DSM 12270]|uniref:Putative nucleotidyl transferase domain-containing protein n=1 Tax=Thermacetogenium phaeum (strain ATCC BAA-254 / DSM 26808 / PB) TaxID=1089553 RepID=K4LJJ4_THEPS|nr:nucleotidyltransferase domain-containing protein [Thermacetogenium phaeum]AFV12130.1 putative nucleotidyl transferase domain-containing protein [Thermacetogenium phaeum DSM 12270]